MAKKNTENVTPVVTEQIDPLMQMVELPMLFKDDNKYSAPAIVVYNGKAWSIPRGVRGLMVPKPIRDILEDSEYQKQFASSMISKLEGDKKVGEF